LLLYLFQLSHEALEQLTAFRAILFLEALHDLFFAAQGGPLLLQGKYVHARGQEARVDIPPKCGFVFGRLGGPLSEALGTAESVTSKFNCLATVARQPIDRVELSAAMGGVRT
jgi:hypothetical protein